MSTIDQQFVEYIVKTLVNNPDKVQITRAIDYGPFTHSKGRVTVTCGRH